MPILFFKLYQTGSSFLNPTNNENKESAIPSDYKISELQSETEQTNWSIYNQREILVSATPNPSSSIINLQIENTDSFPIYWAISDTRGKIIKQDISNNSNFSIDLTVYENGIYFIQLITIDGQTATTTIVKQ